jgi:hypothetical protein
MPSPHSGGGRNMAVGPKRPAPERAPTGHGMARPDPGSARSLVRASRSRRMEPFAPGVRRGRLGFGRERLGYSGNRLAIVGGRDGAKSSYCRSTRRLAMCATVEVVADLRPLVVLVNGAPGSGKTTLASTLSHHLLLPLLNKDDLVHGVWRTRRRAFELGLDGAELLYATMELWLTRGVSFIADHTFPRGVAEPDVAARLAPGATLVHIYCQAVDAPSRWEQRMRSEPLCGEQRLDALRPVVLRLQAELSDPLELGCPTIVVDTTDGYRPGVDRMISQINELHGPATVHDLDTARPSR